MLTKLQVNFFMIFRDFLQIKYHKSLSSVKVEKIGLHVYISLRTGAEFLGKKMSANQNAHTTFFTCEKISYNQSKRSYDFFHM